MEPLERGRPAFDLLEVAQSKLKVDDDGLMVWANLIIATGHNNLAMNQAIHEVAEAYVDGNKLQEGMLNRVEAVIRCYLPKHLLHHIEGPAVKVRFLDASRETA